MRKFFNGFFSALAWLLCMAVLALIVVPVIRPILAPIVEQNLAPIWQEIASRASGNALFVGISRVRETLLSALPYWENFEWAFLLSLVLETIGFFLGTKKISNPFASLWDACESIAKRPASVKKVAKALPGEKVTIGHDELSGKVVQLDSLNGKIQKA